MQLVSDFGGHADGPVAFCLSNLAGFQEKSYFRVQRTAVQARYTFTLEGGCMFGMKLKLPAVVVVTLGALALVTPTSRTQAAANELLGCTTVYCWDSCPDLHTFCTNMGCQVQGAQCTFIGCFGINTQHWYDYTYSCGGAT